MIFHRLKKVKKGKKHEYKIELIERHFFYEKTLVKDVMQGIKKEKAGLALVEVLDHGFKNGVKAAELKLDKEIKL